ncbi:MAG: 3D domain-containing protein [Sedimentisphaerales bacterium]|nr:3D domain-containing protein [Sedimentisphaerales bacterium]
MEKAKFNRSCGVFLKIVNLAAVICIVFLLADIARSVRNSGNLNEPEKSNISNEVSTKSDSPIILLSSTIAEVESTVSEIESKDSSVSKESEATTEPEPKKMENIQATPEDDAKQQPKSSEIKPEINIESSTEINTESNPEAESNAEENKTERYIELPGEWEIIEMRVTAYCPCPSCCGEYSDGITACGYEIQPGDTFVAADRRFPFHTEMLIPGYSNSQPVKVLDRGGAIKGNRLDVFFATHEEALQWGVQYLEVNVRLENL